MGLPPLAQSRLQVISNETTRHAQCCLGRRSRSFSFTRETSYFPAAPMCIHSISPRPSNCDKSGSGCAGDGIVPRATSVHRTFSFPLPSLSVSEGQARPLCWTSSLKTRVGFWTMATKHSQFHSTLPTKRDRDRHDVNRSSGSNMSAC